MLMSKNLSMDLNNPEPQLAPWTASALGAPCRRPFAEHDVNAETGHIFFRNAVVFEMTERATECYASTSRRRRTRRCMAYHLDSTLALPTRSSRSVKSEFREIAPENRRSACEIRREYRTRPVCSDGFAGKHSSESASL